MTKIIDGKIMAKKFFEDYKGKDLASSMSDFVNSLSFDKKGFIEYVEKSENKEEILDVLILWLIKLEYLKDNKYYDLRNEYSINTGVEIAKLLHDKILYVSNRYNYEGFVCQEDYEDGNYIVEKENEGDGNIEDYTIIPIEKEVMFVEEMGRIHRTLQQSFSGIVFEVLLLFSEIKNELTSLDSNFHKVPLI